MREKHKPLLWAIERSWPRTTLGRSSSTLPPAPAGNPCQGATIMVTSIFNGNRREDIWLDK